MNPDAPFAASRFVAYPAGAVAATLAALAEQGWTVTLPTGRFTLGRSVPGAPGGGAGDALLRLGGALATGPEECPFEVEVVVRPCGERAAELRLRLRWSKAAPVVPARLEAGLLLASLGMDRLAADLASGCARQDPDTDTALVTA